MKWVHKTKKRGKLLRFLILLGIIVVLAALFFLYFPNGSNTSSGGSYTPTWTQESLGELEVDPGVVAYTLSQFGVGRLRNVPFTKNNPKIEVIVDGEIYFIEIDNGRIISTLGSTDDEDIRISMSRDNIINILNESNNPIEEIQKAINNGETNLEIVASKTELFTKGYTSIYENFS